MKKLLTLAATLVALTGWSATNNLDIVSFACDPAPDTDPLDFLQLYESQSGLNYSGHADAGYDALVDAARHARNPAERLARDPAPDTDPLDFTLYFSKDTNVWTHVKATTLSTATVELPSQGLWYFIVTSWASRATDGTNRVRVESLPSNMVSYQTPQQPGAPGALRLVTAIATRVSTITVSSNLVYAP